MSLLQPSRRLCKRWLLRTAQLMSRSRGSRRGWGRKARLLTIHRDGERRSFSSPNSIDREADVAPPPPNLAEISPSQPPGARQSPALISDRFLPAWKGLFLSCFLSSMATLLPPSYKVLIHTSGAGASSRGVPGTVPRARGAPGPWQMPPSRGASCRTGAALGKSGVGREGAGVGERSIPGLPPEHPPPHPPLPEQDTEPTVLWGGFSSGGPGESSEVGGGRVGCARAFPSTHNFVAAGFGSGGHPRWHPPEGEGPHSIPGWSCCVGPVPVPGGAEESVAGWGPYWAHLFPATGEGTAWFGGCISSGKD